MSENLTNPETKTVVIDKFQIKSVSLQFYRDNQNMESCMAMISVRKGTGDAPNFVEASVETYILEAEELLPILIQVDAMNTILPALVAKLKQKNLV